MPPEPSELIEAFESKVPFFRGLGSGVLLRFEQCIELCEQTLVYLIFISQSIIGFCGDLANYSGGFGLVR